MNVRLTPLNIVSSVLIVSIAYLLFFPDENGWRYMGVIPLVVMLVVSFISDILFRRLLVNLKRIWLFELLFLIFVVILILLIKTQFK
jgi:quinol-cytochrome oxidoreductase complex cytochrome b subunit